MALIGTIVFIIYPIIGGMVANVVTQCDSMNDLATFV